MKCPLCQTTTIKNGLIRLSKSRIYQRYKCSNCGRMIKGEIIATTKL